jgi:hypothetical protein
MNNETEIEIKKCMSNSLEKFMYELADEQTMNSINTKILSMLEEFKKENKISTYSLDGSDMVNNRYVAKLTVDGKSVIMTLG